jgi:hypothetical protein
MQQDMVTENEFVFGLRKYIAERAKIKTFFNFEVDVDFESKRIYPLPDVDSFIEILHRTSMSVLWVAANFRPVMKVSSRA